MSGGPFRSARAAGAFWPPAGSGCSHRGGCCSGRVGRTVSSVAIGIAAGGIAPAERGPTPLGPHIAPPPRRGQPVLRPLVSDRHGVLRRTPRRRFSIAGFGIRPVRKESLTTTALSIRPGEVTGAGRSHHGIRVVADIGDHSGPGRRPTLLSVSAVSQVARGLGRGGPGNPAIPLST